LARYREKFPLRITPWRGYCLVCFVAAIKQDYFALTVSGWHRLVQTMARPFAALWLANAGL
jgi:hypothetical protein